MDDVLNIRSNSQEPLCSDSASALNESSLPHQITPPPSNKESPLIGPGPKRDGFIGKSLAMKRIYRDIGKVAGYDSSVYILGESGTGKELVAKAIHHLSPRSLKPLIALNCAAISQNLAEGELFGHEKGAFTGAIQRQPGKIEMAQGGTLFLDEIGELSLDLQAKLLRAIQEKTIYRLGGQKPIHVDVRIVVATNKDLQEEVKQGHFREDLYFRLNVFPIVLPPLRKRIEDISLLTAHFLNQFSSSVLEIHPSVLSYFQNYAWPGNVRELMHVIERAVVRHEGNGPLTMESFFPSENPLTASIQKIAASYKKGTLSEQLEELELQIIQKSLLHFRWHKSKTALALGITRKTLDRKIKKYRLKNQSNGGTPHSGPQKREGPLPE